MAYIPKNKSVARNLKKAREIEKHTILSREKEVEQYKKGLSFVERLKRLLSPSLRNSKLQSKTSPSGSRGKNKKALNR